MTTTKPTNPLNANLAAIVAQHVAKARQSDASQRWINAEDAKVDLQVACYRLRLGPRDYAAAIKAYERAMRTA